MLQLKKVQALRSTGFLTVREKLLNLSDDMKIKSIYQCSINNRQCHKQNNAATLQLQVTVFSTIYIMHILAMIAAKN